MNILAHITLYCERSDPGLWAEPLNVLSNLAFLLAAWLLWQQAPRLRNAINARRLALLIAGIGVASGLFHIFGTVWGMWLDVISITLFILAYLYQYLNRLARWQPLSCVLALLSFVALDRAINALGSLGLNGSEAYLLPGGLLLVLTLWSRRHTPTAASWLSAATVLFALSLSLRTLDMSLCAHWPHGTHFAWHLLNACVLYCCVRGLSVRDDLFTRSPHYW